MRKPFLGLAIALLIAACAPLAAQAEIVDQIVAIVNNDAITYSEMRKVLNPIYGQYQKAYQGEELMNKMIKAKNEVLNQLIENKLLAQEAREREIEIPAKEIDEHIDRIKSRFSSAEEFERVMSAEGMSMDQLRKSVEEQYLIRGLVQRELAPRAVVGPSEIEAYYKGHGGQFQEPETVQASHVMVKFAEQKPVEKAVEGQPAPASGPSVDTALQKIKEARAELDKGAKFEDVAKKYSDAPDAEDGGDLGTFSRGKMIKEIEDAAFALQPGQISEVVKSPMGYHVLIVKSKTAARPIPLAEVQKAVEQEIFQQKTDAMRKDLVVELKKKAFVQILE